MHNTSRLRAFKSMTHAVIISIFGDSPEKHPSWSKKISIDDVDQLDGALVQRGLDMVMLGHRPDLGLESLQSSGFLAALLPDVQRMVGFGGYEEGHKDLWEHTKRVVRNAPPRLEVRWAALFHDVGKPTVFRKKDGKVTFHGHEIMSVSIFLRICQTTVLFPDKKFRDDVATLIETLGHIESYRDDWTDSAVRRVRRKVEDDGVWSDLLDLARSDCTSVHKNNRDRARAKTDELETRARELIRIEDEENRLKPPKGTGDVVARVLNVSGRELGASMSYLAIAIKEGLVRPGLSAESYADWLLKIDRDELLNG